MLGCKEMCARVMVVAMFGGKTGRKIVTGDDVVGGGWSSGGLGWAAER
jgi:hypothetical protein